MNHVFKTMQEKLNAIRDLKELGINGEQAVDIVFESILENEKAQLMEQIFKLAFLYGQYHEHNKKDANYIKSDLDAKNECIKLCMELIK